MKYTLSKKAAKEVLDKANKLMGSFNDYHHAFSYALYLLQQPICELWIHSKYHGTDVGCIEFLYSITEQTEKE